jgi:hypothetical protein
MPEVLPLAHRLVPRLIHGLLVLLTNLRHGLASGLFAGVILISAMGSSVGLRVLHGWLDRGSMSRLRRPLFEHQRVSRVESLVGFPPIVRSQLTGLDISRQHYPMGHIRRPITCDDRYVQVTPESRVNCHLLVLLLVSKCMTCMHGGTGARHGCLSI